MTLLSESTCSIVDHFEKLTLSLFKEEGFDTLSKFKNRFSFHSDKVRHICGLVRCTWCQFHVLHSPGEDI